MGIRLLNSVSDERLGAFGDSEEPACLSGSFDPIACLILKMVCTKKGL